MQEYDVCRKTYRPHLFPSDFEAMNYILDRNYIIEIDNYISDKRYDVETINKAKKLDSSENFVSALSSILEGSDFSHSCEAIRADVLREANALGKFFKNAHTDSSFFKQNVLETVLGLEDHKKYEGKIELDSFSAVKNFLGRENSKDKCWGKFNELIEFKESIDYVWGMAFIVATASIFGHQGARAVLKLNKATSPQLEYNSYSDLKLISLIQKIKYEFSQMTGGKNIKFVFKTRDQGLIRFRDSCVFNKVESKNTIYGVEDKFSLDLNKFVSDLPFVSKKKKQELICTLSNPVQPKTSLL